MSLTMAPVTGYPAADLFTERIDFTEERTLHIPDMILDQMLVRLKKEGWWIVWTRPHTEYEYAYLVRIQRKEDFT